MEQNEEDVRYAEASIEHYVNDDKDFLHCENEEIESGALAMRSLTPDENEHLNRSRWKCKEQETLLKCDSSANTSATCNIIKFKPTSDNQPTHRLISAQPFSTNDNTEVTSTPQTESTQQEEGVMLLLHKLYT